MSENTHPATGVLAAWLGSFIGALLVGLPGAFVGAMWGDATTSGFDEIGTGVTYAFYGLLFGAWVGAGLGCVVALRLRRYDRAPATGATLALLLLIGWLLWAAVLIDLGDVLAIYIPLTGAAAAPVVARSITAAANE